MQSGQRRVSGQTPGTRPDASGGPQITYPFVEPVKSPWHVRRLLAAIQGDGTDMTANVAGKPTGRGGRPCP